MTAASARQRHRHADKAGPAEFRPQAAQREPQQCAEHQPLGKHHRPQRGVQMQRPDRHAVEDRPVVLRLLPVQQQIAIVQVAERVRKQQRKAVSAPPPSAAAPPSHRRPLRAAMTRFCIPASIGTACNAASIVRAATLLATMNLRPRRASLSGRPGRSRYTIRAIPCLNRRCGAAPPQRAGRARTRFIARVLISAYHHRRRHDTLTRRPKGCPRRYRRADRADPAVGGPCSRSRSPAGHARHPTAPAGVRRPPRRRRPMPVPPAPASPPMWIPPFVTRRQPRSRCRHRTQCCTIMPRARRQGRADPIPRSTRAIISTSTRCAADGHRSAAATLASGRHQRGATPAGPGGRCAARPRASAVPPQFAPPAGRLQRMRPSPAFRRSPPPPATACLGARA